MGKLVMEVTWEKLILAFGGKNGKRVCQRILGSSWFVHYILAMSNVLKVKGDFTLRVPYLLLDNFK
jgi:hypothetical protein